MTTHSVLPAGVTERRGHPHPASRRARAFLRRRRRAATRQEALPRRRRAAGPRHLRRGDPVDPDPRVGRLRRRRLQVLAAMGVLSLVGAVLAIGGVGMVRSSTAGRYVEPGASPTEPGYQAHVVPTPTLAVVHPGSDGNLAGLTLLTLGAEDEGGAVVLVPPSTLIPFGEAQITIADAYADSGSEIATGTLEGTLGIAIAETAEVDDARWAELVGPLAPIAMDLDQPVDGVDTGIDGLDADQVGPFLAAIDDDETDLDRLERAADFWRTWLAQVKDGDDSAVPGELEVGIGRFIHGLAAGHPTIVALPMVPERTGDLVHFQPSAKRIAALISDVVPYPVSPSPGVRPRVRLLNGTPQPGLTAVAAQRLVEAGAEITIAGNGPSFAVPDTRIIYQRPGSHEQAVRLADGLGVGKVEEAEPIGGLAPPDDEIDVTVILGIDAEDQTEGLETAD